MRKKYYKNKYIYVDCKIEDEIREFCLGTANAEKIVEYISLRKGKQIDENTLLIFDEVQECPNIISALKYFCQDLRDIPVIATVGINPMTFSSLCCAVFPAESVTPAPPFTFTETMNGADSLQRQLWEFSQEL